MAEQADIILGSREEYELTMALLAPGLDDAGTAAYLSLIHI